MERTCSVDGCGRKHFGKGLCNTHYLRVRRGKAVGGAAIRRMYTVGCVIPGCEAKHYALEMCVAHWTNNWRWGSPEGAGPAKGPRHHDWRGNSVSYFGLHNRIAAARGRASQYVCISCGAAAHEWAYDHADDDELWQEINGKPTPYSVDIDHYDPMCKSCHKSMDNRHAKEKE